MNEEEGFAIEVIGIVMEEAVEVVRGILLNRLLVRRLVEWGEIADVYGHINLDKGTREKDWSFHTIFHEAAYLTGELLRYHKEGVMRAPKNATPGIGGTIAVLLYGEGKMDQVERLIPYSKCIRRSQIDGWTPEMVNTFSEREWLLMIANNGNKEVRKGLARRLENLGTTPCLELVKMTVRKFYCEEDLQWLGEEEFPEHMLDLVQYNLVECYRFLLKQHVRCKIPTIIKEIIVDHIRGVFGSQVAGKKEVIKLAMQNCQKTIEEGLRNNLDFQQLFKIRLEKLCCICGNSLKVLKACSKCGICLCSRGCILRAHKYLLILLLACIISEVF